MNACPTCKEYEWVAINLKEMKKLCHKCGTIWDLQPHEKENILRKLGRNYDASG